MSEAYSRRLFLARDVTVILGTAALAPSLMAQEPARGQELRYGEFTEDGIRLYSWQEAQKLLGLERADEDAFHRRLIERYNELTAAYQDATRSGPSGFPDFRQLFGLGRNNYFQPPSRDIPKGDLRYLLNIYGILDDAAKLRRLKKDISRYDGSWSMNGIRFADGNRYVMPLAISLPDHDANGRAEDWRRWPNENRLEVSQYSNGTRIYYATLYDADEPYNYENAYAPAEHRRIKEIEKELYKLVSLVEVTPGMIERRDGLKQELEDLKNSEAVRKFLKEQDEAAKVDMILSRIQFRHPYEIHRLPDLAMGNDNYYFELSGEGIFQSGVHEQIEMPGSSPLGAHAGRPGPYSKEYRISDLPKEDAKMLQAYFVSVLGNLRRVDELLARL